MALPIAQRRARNTTLAGAPREFEDIYDQMGQLIIDADGVRAELSEGILTVVVPKSATEKNHHIQIAD